MDVAISKNNVPIRLTVERWYHITTGHPEVADYYYEILETIENPQAVYEGTNNGLIALSFQLELSDKFLVVIYRETNETDGFVITAYVSNKIKTIQNKKLLWKP